MVRTTLVTAALIEIIAVASGCDSGAVAQPDRVAWPDAGRVDSPRTQADGVVAQADRARGDTGKSQDTLPGTDGGGGPRREFVVDDLLLPMNAAQAQQYGKDLNGDGKVDNALGNIFANPILQTLGLNPQESVSKSIDAGKLLTVIRLQASDFVNAASATGTIWKASPQACCTSTSDAAACDTEAKKICFTGTHAFEPDPASPTPVVAAGSISASKITFGPANLQLTIPILGAPVTLTLKKGTLAGKIGTSPSQITEGTISGAIPQSDIDNHIVPAIAAELDQTLKDPTGNLLVKMFVAGFDTDKDGTISAAEVSSNGLVKPLLTGDVDVDGDGVKELSLGVGFTAVGAVINTP